MLIDIGPCRPDLERVRRSKETLREALNPRPIQVCTELGFDVRIAVLAPLLQEN